MRKVFMIILFLNCCFVLVSAFNESLADPNDTYKAEDIPGKNLDIIAFTLMQESNTFIGVFPNWIILIILTVLIFYLLHTFKGLIFK